MARTRSTPDSPAPDAYTVVARRYRPQRFEDVVGQDHVVQALRNAIKHDRVAQAYVFSGTRGVGKTSMARIFAKCLNCVKGPTTEPCNQCDICQAISAGQDVDVIEIDGASNNGVESVRELRQNAGLRPSRCRYKIYYIDEVHMLSTGAFNALLKTLEEPPEHVKFFFATTEPNKIPITVLSRCQKFDFAGIRPEQITETLAAICEREGVSADPDALQVLARRAGGSMRDAQSLLEQLLSSADRLSAETVHAALGLAPDDRVLDLIDALADGASDRALTLLDQAVSGGVQPVDLLSESLEFLRDVMVLAAGAPGSLLNAPPSARDRLQKVASRWSIDSILAALQILAEARGRLRGSPHGRLLVELALCRAARLEDFADLGDLVARLSGSGSPGEKKKPLTAEPRPDRREIPPRRVEPPPRAEPSTARAPAAPVSEPTPVKPASTNGASAQPLAAGPQPLSLDSARAVWETLIQQVESPLSNHLSALRPSAIPEPGVLVVDVPPMYNWRADACEAPEARLTLESRLRALMGRDIALVFQRATSTPGEEDSRGTRASSLPSVHPDVLAADPLVQDVLKWFEARPVRVEPEDGSES